MSIEDKKLKVFGYGLGIIIPFIIMMHSFKLGLHWFYPAVFLILLLIIISNINKTKTLYYLLVIVFYITIAVQTFKGKIGLIAGFFFLVSIFCLYAVNYKLQFIKLIYDKWMPIVHFIGNTLSSIVLSIMFYIVFGIPGIILRIIGKDLLDQKIEPEGDSYWIKREKTYFNKETYKQQF